MLFPHSIAKNNSLRLDCVNIIFVSTHFRFTKLKEEALKGFYALPTVAVTSQPDASKFSWYFGDLPYPHCLQQELELWKVGTSLLLEKNVIKIFYQEGF